MCRTENLWYVLLGRYGFDGVRTEQHRLFGPSRAAHTRIE
jgi:hypothetical protein